jgi:hypothetical protein
MNGITVLFDQTKFTALYKNFPQKLYLEAWYCHLSSTSRTNAYLLDLSYNYIITI